MKVEGRRCLGCGSVLTGATPLEGEERLPEQGDATVCMYCGYLQMFDEGQFRVPTDEELEELVNDPDIAKAREALALYWKKRE